MNLDQLKTFAALAESGSLRSAADRLGLSPSSAAERVSLLEHELGLRLLDRGARGCTLTRSGAQYLKDARALLGAWDAIAARVAAAGERPASALRIAVAGGSLPPVLGPVLDRFIAEHPEVVLSLLDDRDASVGHELRSGALDAYFLYCPSEALCVGLRRQTVFYTRLCALIPLDHPLSARKTLSLAELEGEMLLLYPPTREPALHQRILEALHAAGVRAALYAGKSSPTLYQMQVKMGCGIAICPQLALKTPPQTVAIPLSDPLCRIQIEMLSAEENPNPAFRLFLEEFGDRSGADIG